ncbi:DgyrCDS7980 [Dimorphilus gyrociliatus]|uniref:DgyrCDS7980 n=1 Tax=Dimorphilus gyrociliatus TaxID=2664684 RepID=A0A7I8VSX7_9ANNE|nr:DgyrCDS7980 [Dimorphilus gyrociliatus]
MLENDQSEDERIGKLTIYYCKQCNLKSDNKSTIKEHIKTCFKNDLITVTIEETDINPIKRRKFKKPPDFIGKKDLDSMLICLECPQSKFYNSYELEIHHKCHSNIIGSGQDIILSCFHCDYGLGEKADWSRLRIHLYQMHKIDFTIECKYCQNIYPVATEYQKHLKEVHYICCSKCSFKTEYQQNFEAHSKCHIRNSKHFRCFICGYSYNKLPSRWSLMAKHIILHHPQTVIPPYQCPNCQEGCAELPLYYKHLKHCLKKRENSSYKIPNRSGKIKRLAYEATNSSYTIPDVSQLICIEEDINAETGKNCTYYCDEHDFLTDSLYTILHHHGLFHSLQNEDNLSTREDLLKLLDDMNTKHANEPIISESDTPRCCYCKRTFSSREAFIFHWRKSHSALDAYKRFKCQYCEKIFRSQGSQQTHISQFHRPKSKSKLECSKKSKIVYVCEECGYTTPVKKRLSNHRLSVHEGVKPYNCSKCTFKTNEVSDLKRHLNKHDGLQKFKCQLCPYASYQRFLLVNHCSRTHNIQLPRASRNTLGNNRNIRFSNRVKNSSTFEDNV